MKTIIKPQPTEANPVTVGNYPYGYHKTECRFWIESKKNKGDRFVKQTLNPKTNKWNKPKKSTYYPVMVAFKDDEGKVNWTPLSSYTSTESLERFRKLIGDLELNDLQKDMLKFAYAFNKAHENVTYECRAVKYRNKITGEIVTSVNLMEMSNYEKVPTPEKDAEQEKIKQHINNTIGYHYNNPIVA